MLDPVLERLPETRTVALDPATVAEIRAHRTRQLARHTHATLGLAAGISPRVMQERLGHSSVAITLDLYTHPADDQHADAAARVAALFS